MIVTWLLRSVSVLRSGCRIDRALRTKNHAPWCLLLSIGIAAVTIEQFIHLCRPDFVSKKARPPLKELHTAIELWLKAAKKVGNPIPRPSDRSDVTYSGKSLMRVPKRLHAELVHAAKAQGVSLNQYVLYLLTKGHHGARAKRAA